MRRKTLPAEALVGLRRRLSTLAPRSPERRHLMQETAGLYGVSESTLYRLLQRQAKPRALRRADCGVPRVLPAAALERYIELIAALKLRTSNRQGRHLSTAGAIRLLEDYGLGTAEGVVRVPQGVLTIPTVNRYLKQWGYDRATRLRPPPAVRFQASASNEWQFTPEIIASVLARGLDDLEPTLARHGYTAKALADVLHVRPAEMRAFLRGRLPAGRAQELQSELRAVGLPL